MSYPPVKATGEKSLVIVIACSIRSSFRPHRNFLNLTSLIVLVSLVKSDDPFEAFAVEDMIPFDCQKGQKGLCPTLADPFSSQCKLI